MVRVTVAIPCLNEARHIAACVEDVLAQDYPAELVELLVGLHVAEREHRLAVHHPREPLRRRTGDALGGGVG